MPSIILSDNGVSSGSAGLKSTAASDGALALQTTTSGGTATTAVTIDTSQNVGLGVTPSAWSGFTALQIQNGALFTDSTSFRSIMNGYYNGSNWIYSTTNAATRYEQVNGIHRWFNAASGTAGNAISFTQAMTLDASGNLGVGTTSPSGRLDVQNNQNSTSNFYFRNTDTTNTSSRAALNVVSGTQSLSFLAINGDNTFIQRASGSLQFQLSGSTQALIDSSGNLLVGTTTAIAPLTIQKVTGGYTACFSSDGLSSDSTVYVKAANGAAYNAKLYLECPGSFGAGMYTNRASTQLRLWCSNDTVGVSLGSGATSWGTFSDERLKDIIEPIENAIQKVSTLRAVIGKYKTDEETRRRSFLIAQDVRAVLPEAVYQNSEEDDTLSLSYTDTIPLLVAAIKEQQAIIESLKARLDAANL